MLKGSISISYHHRTTSKYVPSEYDNTSTSPICLPSVHIKNYPELELLQLDLPTAATNALFIEETAHYPIKGPLADLEWASLLPKGLHSVVLMGPDSNPRLYAVAMFHTLHYLD
ncbi:hypothetical protein JVU11DRAFT_9363 [Chiua virens]|nr:hypothetical protein JVU11DRAFT_9363 [Chiua virens]